MIHINRSVVLTAPAAVFPKEKPETLHRMSALGQKQTCATHNAMSALVPKATLKIRTQRRSDDCRNTQKKSPPQLSKSGYISSVASSRGRLSVQKLAQSLKFSRVCGSNLDHVVRKYSCNHEPRALNKTLEFNPQFDLSLVSIISHQKCRSECRV